jgi:hypothetical protein
MIAKNNKKCIICGTAYSYCPNCGADRKKPSWYAIFDGENCNNIYEILTGYRDGAITIDEAYNKLKDCDLTKINDEEFNVGTRQKIQEILASKDEKFTEPVIEVVEPVEETVEEVVEPATVVEEVITEEKSEVVEESKKQDNFKRENKFNGNNKHFNKNYK